MRTADKERGLLIVHLIDKNKWSMGKVAEKLRLRSRSTVHEIYWREKYGVRRIKKPKVKLSTASHLRVRE